MCVCIYIYIYIYTYTSIGDLTSLDIIIHSPDDDSLELKCYSVDFLLH